MVITGFKSEVDAVTLPPKLFFEPTLEQFQVAFANNFWPFFQNSITSSVVSVILVIVLALPAAYSLSIRPIRKWRDVMFFLLSTRMLPIAGAIIPIYLIANWLGLLDQTVLLVIMYTAMNLPLAVWLIRSFMVEIPTEILEAARVDGATFFQELWRIVLPMVAPGLAATALLCFIFSWNEFFLARSLTSVQAQTVPLYLVGFISTQGLFLAKLSAASLLATLPVVLAGLIAQKQLVRGLSLGAIK
ncbi:carbohydrate ABC transporter permease [Microbacterium sp. AK031]|uniref:carbohydrate ABC transporter permease n=1 Tax=Microbacterium sp. AK031 TaxID=2723076 RepID=UPI0021687F74|nr:carbohydrate ABC transporter permease [Microbacterium sp. AK031]MCS3845057.1 sorbitol/mannitol transport system permease protein [Microbacterium sp. AK031]